MECETGAQSHGVGVYGDGELGSATELVCRKNWGLACPAVGQWGVRNWGTRMHIDKRIGVQSWEAGMHGACSKQGVWCFDQSSVPAQSQQHPQMVLSRRCCWRGTPRYLGATGQGDPWKARPQAVHQQLLLCPKAPVLSPQPGGFPACVGGFSLIPEEKRKLLTLLITEQSWNKQTWRAQS